MSFAPSRIEVARQVLRNVALVSINRVARPACNLALVRLHSLDAIHLATAIELMPRVRTVLTYDERLAGACRHHGLAVAAPA
ncbi:MAG: VapC toxin family PIN domain ribonuclease [Candidatus Dormiibacterota bacterium]